MKTMSNNTSNVGNIYSLDNPAFCSYLICISLLIIKMMATTLMIIVKRLKTKTFISEEDAAAWPGANPVPKPNEEVERVRRAYQNDMENILLFMVISLGYLSIQPPLWAVNGLFLVFLIARILHTVVYAVYAVRPPTRGIMWFIGFIIIGYMATHTAIHAILKGYLHK